MIARNNQFLRELRSNVYAELSLTPDFIDFVDAEVLPELTLHGYKREAKRQVARHAVHNLILCAFGAKDVGCVADSRDTSSAEVRMRAGVWTAIVEAGFARVAIGSQATKMRTRYQATMKLLKLRDEWPLRLVVGTVEPTKPKRTKGRKADALNPLIDLRSGTRDRFTRRLLPKAEQNLPLSIDEYGASRAQTGPDGKPDPQAIQNGRDYRRAVAQQIEEINRCNTAHAWQAFAIDKQTGIRAVFQVDVRLSQRHSVHAFHRVRFYTQGRWGGQSLPKAVRRSMRIDGEPTAELDFVSMLPRMLYHRAGLDPQGDVYFPERVFPKFYASPDATPENAKIVRNFIKRATVTCWNVESEGRAIGSVEGQLRRNGVLRVVADEIEGLDADGIVRRLQKVHAPIAGRFFTQIGAEMMTTESSIMFQILRAFAAADRPALGIHDAIVCKASDAEFARTTMIESYWTYLLKEPKVDRVH